MNLIKKLLAAPVAVLALWAVSAQAATVEELSPKSAKYAEIAERLQPVGQVCVSGQECKGVGAVAVAAGGAAMSADDVVAKYCGACHTAGVLGAPKIGDAAWKDRASAKGGIDGLLKSAIAGINAMPPKGTCATCSDDELKGAIKKMSGL